MTLSLTCFIRSKSKASIATSLLLLTGFILEKWKKSIKKPVSSLQCVLSCTHLMVWMKSTPEWEHLCSSAGQEAPYWAAQEYLAAREQHCSCMHYLTLKDAVSFCFSLIFVCVCMCVGNLNDFRLENAEGIKPVKHCVLLQHLQFANYVSGFLSQSLFCTAALL